MLAAGFAGFPQISKDTARTINTAIGHIGVTVSGGDDLVRVFFFKDTR